VILSTNWEGLPLVPLEAGGARKPVVASDVDGVREVVRDEETGFLFVPGSLQSLSEKIVRLYEHKDLRDLMGKQNYDFVSQNFTLKQMLEEYEHVYKLPMI